MSYFKLLMMRSYWYQHLVLLVVSLLLIMVFYFIFLWGKYRNLMEQKQMMMELKQELTQITIQLEQFPLKGESTAQLDRATADKQPHQTDNLPYQSLSLAKQSQMILLLLRCYHDNQVPLCLIELRGHYAQFIDFVNQMNKTVFNWQITQISIVPEEQMLIFSLTLTKLDHV